MSVGGGHEAEQSLVMLQRQQAPLMKRISTVIATGRSLNQANYAFVWATHASKTSVPGPSNSWM